VSITSRLLGRATPTGSLVANLRRDPDRSGPQRARIPGVDTPTRLLRLLTLFSARAWWTATELASETRTTDRTVRRDVARLRDLGYPIEATTGPYGGYTLGRGGRLPPLVLDDEEAVAVVVGLRRAAGAGTGTEAAALSALATLDQVMPTRLRERASALATVTVGLNEPVPSSVDVDALMNVALACRRSERLVFTYTDAENRVTDRVVEPFRIVNTDRRWYLVAFDTTRTQWRTFRVDRMSGVALDGTRFAPATDPPDAAALVSHGIAVATYDIQARVRLHCSAAEAARVIPRTIAVLEPETEQSAIAIIGGDADWIARYLAGLEFEYEVLEPDEVRAELRALGRRLVRQGS
jgi:predicted DNA-binding transcriptional regulator YafY